MYGLPRIATTEPFLASSVNDPMDRSPRWHRLQTILGTCVFLDALLIAIFATATAEGGRALYPQWPIH